MEKITINNRVLTTPDFWEQHKDVLKGYRLSVTLGFDTPYEYIMMASAIYDDPEKLPTVPPQFGTWMPYLGGTGIEGTRASHFGPVTDAYAEKVLLPFLAEYRKIIESCDAPERKKSDLDELGQKLNVWQKYIGCTRYKYLQSLGDLWAYKNMTSIKGIGPAKAQKLIEQGIYTKEQYEKQGTKLFKPI